MSHHALSIIPASFLTAWPSLRRWCAPFGAAVTPQLISLRAQGFEDSLSATQTDFALAVIPQLNQSVALSTLAHKLCNRQASRIAAAAPPAKEMPTYRARTENSSRIFDLFRSLVRPGNPESRCEESARRSQNELQLQCLSLRQSDHSCPIRLAAPISQRGRQHETEGPSHARSTRVHLPSFSQSVCCCPDQRGSSLAPLHTAATSEKKGRTPSNDSQTQAA